MFIKPCDLKGEKSALESIYIKKIYYKIDCLTDLISNKYYLYQLDD
ncbi:hypothetical protein HHS_03140 [Candidatus Pantoea carbekii]|uniref:Uncharacterized protein n=1 Tax=Candidatus Pantoea carbekii TaxID=1235990 RepID=U3U7N0_9GAMM|nr:hypothetical protein HHS_03140 [Candidatus Pantoea carbekii]